MFCFSVFFYYTFPYDSLKKLFIHRLTKTSNNMGIEKLEINSLKPHWLTGVQLREVVLDKNFDGIQSYTFKVDSGTIRISISSLVKIFFKSGILSFKVSPERLQQSILNNLDIKYKFKAYDGGAIGSIGLNEPKRIMFESGNFSLEKISFLKTLLDGADVSGIIKSMGLNLEAPGGRLENITGNIIFNLQNAAFDNIKVGYFAIPSFVISSLKINMRSRTGKVQINEFIMTGDIDGRIKGSINLEPNLFYSKINLNASFRLSEKIVKDFEPMLNMLVKPDSSGQYNIRLTGSINSPEATPL